MDPSSSYSRPVGRAFTAEEREIHSSITPLTVQRRVLSATRTRVTSRKRGWGSDLKRDLQNIGWDILNKWDPECNPVELLNIGIDFILADDRSDSNIAYIAQHLADIPLPWDYWERVETLKEAEWAVRACDFSGGILFGSMAYLQVITLDTAENRQADYSSRILRCSA